MIHLPFSSAVVLRQMMTILAVSQLSCLLIASQLQHVAVNAFLSTTGPTTLHHHHSTKVPFSSSDVSLLFQQAPLASAKTKQPSSTTAKMTTTASCCLFSNRNSDTRPPFSQRINLQQQQQQQEKSNFFLRELPRTFIGTSKISVSRRLLSKVSTALQLSSDDETYDEKSSSSPPSDAAANSAYSSQILVPPRFDSRTAFVLVTGQAVIIFIAVIVAILLKTPNYGFGTTWKLDLLTIQQGFLWTFPLGVLAVVLDFVEDKFPALQNVTKATLRSVLVLMGGTFKPLLALLIASALGIVAGLGEELLFRGVFQQQLSTFLSSSSFLPFVTYMNQSVTLAGTSVSWGNICSIGLSSLVFGALHAVTPLYSVLATLASIYFGSLFLLYDQNLAVPMVCHALYDVGALFYAHWTVSKMPQREQIEIANWEPESES